MKNLSSLIAFTLIIALSPVDIHAADGDRVGGLRTGYHSAQFNLNGDFVGEPIQTFYLGFFRDQKVMPVMHFGSGLEYYKNGTRFDSENLRELHYLSIPLNLKFKLGPVFALGGAAPSFRVADRITTEGVKGKPTDDEKSSWFDIPLFLSSASRLFALDGSDRFSRL